MLLLGGLLFIGLSAYASDTEVVAPVSQETRSPLFHNMDLPTKKSLFEKCLLAGKSLGAGAMSTIFGYCCYLNATGPSVYSESKDIGIFEKLQALCVAGAAFVGATKLGGYSVRSIKEALSE